MKRHHRDEAPPLDDYRIVEKMAFTVGWAPGCGRGRWVTWADYLRDFQRLRTALVAWQHKSNRDLPLFGDCALKYRKLHGHAALETARYEDIKAMIPDPRDFNPASTAWKPSPDLIAAVRGDAPTR